MAYYKKRFGGLRVLLMVGALPWFLGCNDEDAQAKIKLLQVKLKSLENNIQTAHAAQDVMNEPLNIEFQALNYDIKDQMFDPVLTGNVQVLASHPQLSKHAFVQIQVDVSFKAAEELSLSNISWVNLVEGKGQSNFEISLPEHQMDNVEASITLTPLSWYRGLNVAFTSSDSLEGLVLNKIEP